MIFINWFSFIDKDIIDPFIETKKEIILLFSQPLTDSQGIQN